MTLLQVMLLAASVPATLSCTYLLLLTLLSASNSPPPAARRTMHFDFVIPAHNEAAGISRTIESVRAVDWPKECFRIIVVADNCTDRTAVIARDAGAIVIERSDTSRRGKGYALAVAFEASRQAGLAEAVVIIDADTDVSANLLAAFAARLEAGANAVQTHYGVRNPNESWRTRLITIAKGSFHIVRSRARERLGVSCGIRGNGWCVTHRLLARVPYNAYSPTEDIEFGISLGLGNERVAYADEADASADMEADRNRARSQRARWEQGRFKLVRAKVGPLLYAALSRPSVLCLDLAMDLLVLPLSYVALNAAALTLAGLALAPFVPGALTFAAVGALCMGALGLYVLRGWQLSGTGTAGLVALSAAPWFIAWKLIVAVGSRSQSGWVRTKRMDE